MRESEIESEVVKYAKKKGCIVIKLNGPNDRGKPDRAFFYLGRVFVIEFKAPGKTTTLIQEGWLRKFRSQLFDAIVIDGIGTGKTAIDKFIEKTESEVDPDLL